MSTRVALLRGVNVGGKHVISSRELVEVFHELGCARVRTYLHSGNVVFEAPAALAGDFAQRVTAAIDARKCFAPAVLLLSEAELGAAIAGNPYPEAESDPKSLHLLFLEETPAAGRASGLDELKGERESFLLRDQVLYLHAPDGVARSRVLKNVDGVLGVAVTARNWRTVTKLAAMAAERW